jgi:hypothetical protein
VLSKGRPGVFRQAPPAAVRAEAAKTLYQAEQQSAMIFLMEYLSRVAPCDGSVP